MREPAVCASAPTGAAGERKLGDRRARSRTFRPRKNRMNTISLNLLRTVALATALAGGFGLAQAADAAASAPVATAVKKTERVASDSWITTKVKSEILASSLTKGFHVRVKTLHGVVILKGKLASQDSIDQVKVIAEKVKGVKSVDASAIAIAAT